MSRVETMNILKSRALATQDIFKVVTMAKWNGSLHMYIRDRLFLHRVLLEFFGVWLLLLLFTKDILAV